MTHIPYGYRIENSIVITHKEEAAKIVALYKAYLKHKTLEGSARAVGINKVHGSIERILKNRCYLGNKIFPQIIDEDLFSAVQKILQSKTFRRKRETVPR
ncbi:hypothetical protein [Streptococcus gallinaceus]|uniref:Recombinase domain-containing protein n=1 Tax=Streptococcus gallinaceus TaxID=165758 RepID=A0ABV2JIX6_9STRE